MENATAIFYDEKLYRDKKLDEPWSPTRRRTSGSATPSRRGEWPHLWLSEGFATYLAALWTRSRRR